MNQNTATNRTRSRRFLSVLLLLTLDAYGVAIGQQRASATSALRITVKSEPTEGHIGINASLVSSMFQEMDAMENPSAEEVRGSIGKSRSSAMSLPALTERGWSINQSDALKFEVEDVYNDPSQGVSAILGCDGKLYMRTSLADDQKASNEGAGERVANVIVIVSVVD